MNVVGLHVDTPPGDDKTNTSNVYAHTRSQGFGHEVQKRILLGTYALTAE
jgi:aspartyl-tRNA(Asn)/glutamyl-tRNA(Gln) amidotransferase subunit A